LDVCSGLGLEEFNLRDGRTRLILERENLSLRQRWQPFSFLDFNCNYSEQKRQEVRGGIPYTVKIIVWPSLDLSLDINKIGGGMGRFSSRLFTSSYLLVGYIEKRIVKEDISSGYLYQPSLTWRGGFKKPEDLALTLNYKSIQEEESYFGQGISSHDFSSHYEVRLDYFTLFPGGERIPLLRRLVNFKDKIHLTLGLNLETKKGFTDERTNQDRQKWRLFGEMGYEVQDNIRMKLGLEAAYLQDGVKAGEDNYSYGASCRVEIRF